ncbi:MAG: PAS domain S-box protein [Candidatus Baltobacteraceae bacterium]|jgi:diguanylate cyclase (GGDEF)-like protein/PAS domain S-box-containing protein
MSHDPATATDTVEQRYRSIVEHVKDVIFQLDLDGRLTYLNPASTELTGLEPGALLGTRFCDLLAAEDRAFCEKQLRHVFDGRTPFCRNDVRCLPSDSGIVWIEVWARATRDAGGAIVGITGTLRDVSERKMIEAAQWEAQEILERGIAQSPVGFFSIGCSGRINRVNAAGARILGREVTALAGKEWRTLVHPDDLPAFLANVKEMFTSRREAATWMIALVRGDGETIYARMHASLLRDAEGSPLEFFCQLEDLTAEQLADRRLRAAEERFRVIFQESPTAMCTAQTDGRLIQLNSALRHNLGQQAPALGTEARFAELVHPQDREREDALFAELVAGKRLSYECELRIHFPRNSWRWCEVRAKLLDDGLGTPSCVLRTLVDVSKRKRSEETLRRQAESDALTGIPNRRAFERIVTDRIAEPRGPGDCGALFLFDLDGFKAVNDTFGHQTGDVLLAAVAKALVARLRASDVVARLGGDEFAVLTPNGGEREMRAVADAIVQTIEKTARSILKADLPAVSASVGATALWADAEYALLIELVDAAMYRAKRGGGGRAAFAPSPGQHAAGMVYRIPRE